MKEAVLEQGSDAESPHEEEETGKDSKDDRKVMLLAFFSFTHYHFKMMDSS